MRRDCLRNLIFIWTLAAACGGCGLTRRRAFLVTDADVETRLTAQACTAVTRALGEAGAHALLDGHVIRPGEKLVIAVRDWRESDAEPSLRVTITADPELQSEVALPNSEIGMTATRAAADGSRARNLTIKKGSLMIRRVVKEWEIAVELYFNDPTERPFRVSGRLPVLDLYRLDACDGRAIPTAPPADYLGSDPNL